MSMTPEMRENVKKQVLDESNFGPIVDNLFSQTDKDNSGEIDKNELGALLAELGKILGIPPPTQEDIDGELKRLDVNKDGKISKKEFRDLVKDLVLLVVENY